MCQLPCPLVDQFSATFYSVSGFSGGLSPHDNVLLQSLLGVLLSLPYLLTPCFPRAPPRWSHVHLERCLKFALRGIKIKINLHCQFLLATFFFFTSSLVLKIMSFTSSGPTFPSWLPIQLSLGNLGQVTQPV